MSVMVNWIARRVAWPIPESLQDTEILLHHVARYRMAELSGGSYKEAG